MPPSLPKRGRPTIARTALLLILAIVLPRAHGEEERNWSKWRGPNGNSITDESGWDPTALDPKPRILWRAQVKQGYSSVSIQGPHLYTMGYEKGKDTVYCLSVATGKKIWDHTYPCPQVPFPGTRGTPVFDSDRIYTVSSEGLVHCLDAQTGKVLWSKDTEKEANAKAPRWGISTSAVIEGDMVLLNIGKYGLALNKNNGQVVWQSPRALCGYASPVLYDADDRRRFVAFGQAAAYGVDANTGQLLWTKPWFTRLDETSADPIVAKDKVFISSIYSKGCTLFSIADNQPKEIWQNDILVNKFSTTVLYKGHLYGVHGNTGRRPGTPGRGRKVARGWLRCLDFETGEQRWENEIGIASAIIADGKLIVLNERGILYIAQATPDAYHEFSQGRVLPQGGPSREDNRKCWTAPVLCRAMIYCRNDRGDLVCVDMRKKGTASHYEE